MGAEQDVFGLKSLTIKAIKIAANMGDMELLNAVSEDENKSIDMLMQYYVGEVEQKGTVNEFLSSIKMLSQKAS